MSPIFIEDVALVCALGRDREQVRAALFDATAPGGVTATSAFSPGRELHLGVAPGEWPAPADAPLPLRSRNNALLDAALGPLQSTLESLLTRHAPQRIGIIIGSSTSGIGEGESALAALANTGAFPPGFHYGQQDLVSPAHFVAWRSGVAGPMLTVSTACSSSAKALASGARWLRAGICDAVIAGGADSLCAFTVAGFSALESVSAGRCNPSSQNRRGINIGEGAALFVLSREAAAIRLAGWGESSDAHHISAPEPHGRGAEEAMRAALRRARIDSNAVDYINLHGTATPQNDLSESLAVARVFGDQVWCSSTKPLTGHALGAAGAIEAALCWLALTDDDERPRLPPHWWDGAIDPQLAPLRLAPPGLRLGRRMRHALSNSFAFGGNNASLLLSRD
jgi:3-oxoacyl-[acyl-carrier-protein] synthase I